VPPPGLERFVDVSTVGEKDRPSCSAAELGERLSRPMDGAEAAEMAHGRGGGEEERPTVVAHNLEREAEQRRLEGNRRYRAGEWDGAAEEYAAGIALAGPVSQLVATLRANRAAALLRGQRFAACLRECDAACDGGAASLTAAQVRKVAARRSQAVSRQQAAAAAAALAERSLEARAWGAALPAFDEALGAADLERGIGAPAAAARAVLLCGRSDCRAAVGDWGGALADARASMAAQPSRRGLEAVGRLEVFVERQRRRRHPGGDGAAAAEQTGLSPLHTKLTEVCVGPRLAPVKLREVYLCTTGGRLWGAALLLAHWLTSAVSPGGRWLDELLARAGEAQHRPAVSHRRAEVAAVSLSQQSCRPARLTTMPRAQPTPRLATALLRRRRG
jgi:hypothetical protein